MKSLKYVVLVLMLFVGINSVNAQTGKEEMRNQQMEKEKLQEMQQRRVYKELGFTEEQVKRAEDIRSKTTPEIQKLEMQLERLRAEQRKEVEALYTPEQLKKAQQMEQRNEEMKKKEQDMMRREAMRKK